MTLDDAIDYVRTQCPVTIAKQHASMAMDMASENGTEGLTKCVKFILTDIKSWRQKPSIEIKRILKDYVEKNEGS